MYFLGHYGVERGFVGVYGVIGVVRCAVYGLVRLIDPIRWIGFGGGERFIKFLVFGVCTGLARLHSWGLSGLGFRV